MADGQRGSRMSYLDIVYADLGLKAGDYAHQLVDHLVDKCLGGTSLNSEGKPTKSLLDVGAGKGAQAAVFSRYFNITTIDRHGDAKETFESLHIEANVVVAEIGEQPFPLPDKSFDIVFTKSVIEHVENWENSLRDISCSKARRTRSCDDTQLEFATDKFLRRPHPHSPLHLANTGPRPENYRVRRH
jgi:SAM-dependent methyltransferase